VADGLRDRKEKRNLGKKGAEGRDSRGRVGSVVMNRAMLRKTDKEKKQAGSKRLRKEVNAAGDMVA